MGAGGRAGVIPETAVISLVPEGEFDHDVVASFCHFVWFFAPLNQVSSGSPTTPAPSSLTSNRPML